MESETQIKTLLQWVGEGYHHEKPNSHKEWLKNGHQVKKDRVLLLADKLNRTDTTIHNYLTGRIVPSKVIRKKISEVVKENILWVIDNQFIITNYE